MHNKQSSTARAPPVCHGRQTKRVEGTMSFSTFTNRQRHHAADPKEGFTIKNLMVILLLGCALVINPIFRKVALADGFGGSDSNEEIPLSALAGTYAGTTQGSISVS
jgi:hypothetical protein